MSFFESLENRVLMSGSAPTAAFVRPLKAPEGDRFSFKINYDDDTGLVQQALPSSIRVHGPNGKPVRVVVVDPIRPDHLGRLLTVTYQVFPPEGLWSNYDAGTYKISVMPNMIKDLDGNAVAAGKVGSFRVEARNEPPSALVTSEVLRESNGTSTTFDVTYTGRSYLDTSTLRSDTKMLRVTGPNGYVKYAVPIAMSGSNKLSQRVTYRVAANGGRWEKSDNGLYKITLLGGKVRDVDGNERAVGKIGSFEVDAPKLPRMEVVGSYARDNLDQTPFDSFRLEIEEQKGQSLAASASHFDSYGTFFFSNVKLVGTISRDDAHIRLASKNKSLSIEGFVHADGVFVGSFSYIESDGKRASGELNLA